MDQLDEVKEAINNHRFEIVLKNAKLNDSSTKEGQEAQNRVFEKIPQLNLLSITSSLLTELSPSLQICRQNLISLVLVGNQLKTLPDIFDGFVKLKFVDVSNNLIEKLPKSIEKLEKLESLIIANNKLTDEGLPDFSNLHQLLVFDASHNKLKNWPQSLLGEGLAAKFHTVDLSGNSIEEIPDEIDSLKQLKEVKLNKNELQQIPFGMSRLTKLKTLDLSENSFIDTRFKRLTNDKRAKVSAIISYIAKNGKVLTKKNKTSEKAVEEEEKDEEEANDEEKNQNKLKIRTGVDKLIIKRHSSVANIRPYLVCCVFNNVDLDGEAFRKFINLQTKLHSSAISENRSICAIGTHKLSAFQLPLCYLALPKDEIHIRALNKKQSVTGTELIDSLLRDAELARKRSKRNTVDPLHKYLHIVRDEEQLACLVDAQQIVISLPPITNSDSSKLTTDTTSIFVEISSKISLESCKKAMDELVTASRQLFPNLELDQARVVENDILVSIYPDKNDLKEIEVERVEFLEKN